MTLKNFWFHIFNNYMNGTGFELAFVQRDETHMQKDYLTNAT